eukprot:CAMPEP_0202978094 /NCGR_PEP_ID=MMETSP1396-20130829/84638_1 /ASSEMBLY_ACC=CAM_ASM_000872 /TAXON_ID= /ORGANISM="Pseudokeronopsis sp., Strain Brazil" /LENGTH=108 /DNA_ID=CAMNT_0049716963 /DNA_START=948 /DNA_END=1273 /DNA_ORIENTATION=+
MEVHHNVLGICYDKKKQPLELEEEDPFLEDEDQVAAKFGYLYKVWKVGKKRVCIRCTVNTYIPGKKEEDQPHLLERLFVVGVLGEQQSELKQLLQNHKMGYPKHPGRC